MATAPRHVTLRDYITELGRIGDLTVIDVPVDPELELSAVVRRGYDLRTPAPLFTDLRGVGHRARVLGAPGALSSAPGRPFARVALSLGMPADATARAVVSALADVSGRPAVPPRVVPAGRCQEHVHLGAEADVTSLPSPRIHPGDGGRCLNTWGIVIARTPDGTWTNWSVDRAAVLDPHRLLVACEPYRHLSQILRMWRLRGEDMPVAIALGVDPVIPFASAIRMPAFVDEAARIGGYLGEPIDVVRCRTVDLDVPADAEVVIEGTLSIAETVGLRSWGETSGYLRPEEKAGTVCAVSAITHRADPILPAVVFGRPVDESHLATGCATAAGALGLLRDAGLPAVSSWMPPEAAGHVLAVAVDRDDRRHGGVTGDELCRAIAEVVFAAPVGAGVPRIVVLDDDVDVTDLHDLIWAWLTRAHPVRDTLVVRGRPADRPPNVRPAAEPAGDRLGKVVVNALADGHRETRATRMSFERGWPEDIRRLVTGRWRDYGFDRS